MASITLVQASFSSGELDPKLYAQVNFEGYQKGVKSARNCLAIPQGGFRKRWGLTQFTTLTTTNYQYQEIIGFNYDTGTQYLLVFYFNGANNVIDIYLENIRIATVNTTYPQEIVQQLRFAFNQGRVLIFHTNFAPAQLVRSAAAANVITGVNTVTDEINITNPLTVGNVLPITFTTGGALPVSNPQIYVNTIYFALVTGANSIRVFATSKDAANNINFFDITGAGVGNVIVQNTWTLSNIPFSNLPAYDFDSFPTYSAAGFDFQVSAQAGTIAAPTTITASGNVFTAAHVGGLFIGGGGIARIIVFTDAQNVNAITYEPFTVAVGAAGRFPGREAFLGEPAWSAARGFPSRGVFHQESLWVANSRSIPNGLWGSVKFQAYDFDDSEDLDDNAMSDYSAKSAILDLISAKSLIVMCDLENNSTPLTATTPITPRTVFLDEQNKDGVSRVVQSVFIDNQLIYVDRTANNIKNMAWDIVQSSYVNTNISVASAHLVQTPTDMESFAEPIYTDGQYVFVVNQDGSLGIYQTLVEQNIKAWTPADSEQNVTDGLFRRVASVGNRVWFTVERQIVPNAPVAITGFSGVANTLTAVAHGMELNRSNLVKFTIGTSLPVTVPALNVNDYFFARGIDANTFAVYATAEAADADTNRFTVTSAGVGANVVLTPRRLYLEELDYSVQTDSSRKYNFAVATNTLTGLQHLTGETVQIVGNDFVLQEQVVPASGQLILEIPVSTAQVGLQITSEIIPLPLSIQLPTGSNFYQTKHIRSFYVQYFETVTFTLQGFDAPTMLMQDIILNEPPVPRSGIYTTQLMEGWDSQEFDIVIRQTLPLGMTILGIGYNVEVTT